MASLPAKQSIRRKFSSKNMPTASTLILVSLRTFKLPGKHLNMVNMAERSRVVVP